jgi:hypothetical protein
LPSFNWRATGNSTAHKPRLCNLKSTGCQTTRPWASSKANLRSPCRGGEGSSYVKLACNCSNRRLCLGNFLPWKMEEKNHQGCSISWSDMSLPLTTMKCVKIRVLICITFLDFHLVYKIKPNHKYIFKRICVTQAQTPNKLRF